MHVIGTIDHECANVTITEFTCTIVSPAAWHWYHGGLTQPIGRRQGSAFLPAQFCPPQAKILKIWHLKHGDSTKLPLIASVWADLSVA